MSPTCSDKCSRQQVKHGDHVSQLRFILHICNLTHVGFYMVDFPIAVTSRKLDSTLVKASANFTLFTKTVAVERRQRKLFDDPVDDLPGSHLAIVKAGARRRKAVKLGDMEKPGGKHVDGAAVCLAVLCPSHHRRNQATQKTNASMNMSFERSSEWSFGICMTVHASFGIPA